EILEAMYSHYDEVTHGLPAFPEQALFDTLLGIVRRGTPRTISVVQRLTGEYGRFDAQRFIHLCELALKSPRALRELFAA
ncbi:MAG TPA: hypothetical protein VLM85_03155, partial [Polyangiaceae bacterium]|nr:hypothetical protein [Polyangiaceae bacterium]